MENINFFPVNLNIKNRLCVVVGCGNVGERKILNLIRHKPKIRVISNDFTENILKLSDKMELIHSAYKSEYIKDAFMVFICTNRKDLNLEIYRDAKKNNSLVNIVTHPELCDFSIPSVIERGDLKITISTNGKSPALSKKIRKELEERFGNEYSELLNLMDKIRKKQLSSGSNSNDNRLLFKKIIESDILDLIKKKERNKINERIKRIFNFEIF